MRTEIRSIARLTTWLALLAYLGNYTQRLSHSGKSGQDRDLELERWIFEKNVQERELALKERDSTTREHELELKRLEQQSSRWRNPLTVAIFAATVAALGNAYVAYTNANSQRRLEADRSEQARILEVIKVGNPDKAAENMRFLLEAGLISDATLRADLGKYLDARRPGSGVALPAPAGPIQAAPIKIDESLTFDLNATKLSAEQIEKIDGLLGRIRDIGLEVIIVVSILNPLEQESVSVQRFNAIKSYLASKGIEPNRVYPDARPQQLGEGIVGKSHVHIEIVGVKQQRASAAPK